MTTDWKIDRQEITKLSGRNETKEEKKTLIDRCFVDVNGSLLSHKSCTRVFCEFPSTKTWSQFLNSYNWRRWTSYPLSVSTWEVNWLVAMCLFQPRYQILSIARASYFGRWRLWTKDAGFFVDQLRIFYVQYARRRFEKNVKHIEQRRSSWSVNKNKGRRKVDEGSRGRRTIYIDPTTQWRLVSA